MNISRRPEIPTHKPNVRHGRKIGVAAVAATFALLAAPGAEASMPSVPIYPETPRSVAASIEHKIKGDDDLIPAADIKARMGQTALWETKSGETCDIDNPISEYVNGDERLFRIVMRRLKPYPGRTDARYDFKIRPLPIDARVVPNHNPFNEMVFDRKTGGIEILDLADRESEATYIDPTNFDNGSEYPLIEATATDGEPHLLKLAY
jgi:hypothetical protein